MMDSHSDAGDGCGGCDHRSSIISTHRSISISGAVTILGQALMRIRSFNPPSNPDASRGHGQNQEPRAQRRAGI